MAGGGAAYSAATLQRHGSSGSDGSDGGDDGEAAARVVTGRVVGPVPLRRERALLHCGWHHGLRAKHFVHQDASVVCAGVWS